MNKNYVYALLLISILVGILVFAFKIHRVEAQLQTVYIRANGDVEPSWVPIQRNGDVYTFTGDIVVDGDATGMIIERHNMTLDGASYHFSRSLSVAYAKGIELTERNNVTIKNLLISDFNIGISISNSSNNMIIQNSIRDNNIGVSLSGSSSNNFSRNAISANAWWGIHILDSSDSNTFFGNNITGNRDAIHFSVSSANSLHNNLLDENQWAFRFDGSKMNHFLHSIDTSNLVDGRPVYYLIDKHNITISPSTHSAIGFLALINSTEITVDGLNLTKTGVGLLLAYSSNTTIQNNTIINGRGNIDVFNSSHNIITNNNLKNSSTTGILLVNSSRNTISYNNITLSTYADIYFSHSSYNTISGNNIVCNIFSPGIELRFSSNNTFIHNSFIINTPQIKIPNGEFQFWDNGIEGNYWSDYNGVDSNHDGIGDTNHTINTNNADMRPLMGPFHNFNTSASEYVGVVSNSSVTYFNYAEAKDWITIQVRNATTEQAFGFCRISIPHNLIDPEVTWINVVIDDGTVEPLYFNNTLYDNGTHRWIYVAYPHSMHEITIIPEFPSWFILPLFVPFTLLAALVFRRKQTQKPST